MKQTKLFMLLAVLLCATTTVWAQTNVSTDQELRNAIADNANIKVTKDIGLSNSTLEIPANNTVTIDLNGHTLDRGLKAREWNTGGTVITVRSGATLNLSNGTLKGGWAGDSGGLLNETGGTANLTNVTITGCTGDDRGGGISNHGTLTMTRGSITGNTSKDGTDPKGGGGLFNYKGATATLTGVTITGNTATKYGGGGICNFGTLTLNSCTITGNTAGTQGGGIWQEGTLNMQGKNTVTGNTGSEEFADNVFLKSGAVIGVTGALTGSTIGISMEQKPGVFTSGYSTYNSGVSPADIFRADFPEAWEIALNGSEAQLASSFSEDEVYYIERSWDDANKVVKNSVKVITSGEYSTINSQESVDLSGFYVVRGSVTLNKINCHGKVSIILCDGAELTVNNGIQVNDKDNASLYIYSQSYDLSMGRIISHNTDSRSAAIGSTRDDDVGLIEIHGGDIYAYSGFAAGIGAGEFSNGDVVNIYGGKIYARGENGAGIGGGMGYDYTDNGHGGSVTIYDGEITAESSNGAGIGSGRGSMYSGDPFSDEYKDDVDTGTHGGTVVIHGGHINAQGASGIGGGTNSRGGNVTINGGEVYAYGKNNGAGIGSGKRNCRANDFSGGKLTVNGGKVYAYGGDDGAGIGGGNVTITGGTVIAKAGRNETGMRAIGPGEGCDNYGQLTIGNEMMVSSERMAAAAERKNMCWYRTRVRVEPCTHPDHTYTWSGTTKDDTHTEACQYCTTGFKAEKHTFEGGICTVCGVEMTMETGIETRSEVRGQMGDVWYDLNGRRLSGKPTQKGVYINNGNKVVIK